MCITLKIYPDIYHIYHSGHTKPLSTLFGKRYLLSAGNTRLSTLFGKKGLFSAGFNVTTTVSADADAVNYWVDRARTADVEADGADGGDSLEG